MTEKTPPQSQVRWMMNRSVKGKILNTKVGICKGMRIHTDLNEEERERVMKYSKEKGLDLKNSKVKKKH